MCSFMLSKFRDSVKDSEGALIKQVWKTSWEVHKIPPNRLNNEHNVRKMRQSFLIAATPNRDLHIKVRRVWCRRYIFLEDW